MKSLKGRLVLATTITCLVIFVIAGTIMFFLLRDSLIREFDRGLLARAEAIAALVEQDGPRIKVESDGSGLKEYAAKARNDFFQIWSEDGKAIFRSASLPQGFELPTPDFQKHQATYQKLKLPDGRWMRCVIVYIRPRIESDEAPPAPGEARTVALAVARTTHYLTENLRETSWLVVTVFGVATLAAVLGMIWVVNKGLRPVKVLAGKIARTDTRHLEEPITVNETPEELMPIVQRLNELLARINSTMTREKAFTADVAHELRTPIGGLEAALEVCASKPREADEYRRVVDRCLKTVRDMHRLVDNLLLLARAEAGRLNVTTRPVEIEKLLDETWEAYDAQSKARDLDVQWQIYPGLELQTDPSLLGVVIKNIFENAVNHCDAGGKVRVRTLRDRDVVTIEVENTGCEIAPDDAPKVFERFWKADTSRTNTGVHAGLGLALCQEIVELLGGSIKVTIADGSFAISISFPAAARDESSELALASAARPGFTLIELLVVIGIIGVLLAILLPMTERARHKAYIEACGSNLRQLGQALTMYANDNHGHYPRTIYTTTDPLTAGTGSTAPDAFAVAGVKPNDVSAPLWLLARVQKLTPKLFVCPYNDVNEFEPDTNKPEAQANFTNFSKNLGYSYANPYPDAAAAQKGYDLTSKLNGQFAVMADLNPGVNKVRNADPFAATINSPASIMKMANSENHEQEGENVLFADGHVTYCLNPFCGMNNDNIYTSQNAVTPNIMASPAGPGDSVLLPPD